MFSTNGLVESLMEEPSCSVAFTIPLLGGTDVMESAVVTWITMVITMIASLILVHGLKVRNTSRKQAALESGMSFIYDLFKGLLGKEGKAYIPYLIIVVVYIGTASMIGLLGFKSSTKDSNVTVSLAVMSIVLVEVVDICKKGVRGWIKGFVEPIAIIAPINVLELFMRPLPLCMQSFGSVLGVIVVMALIKCLLPLIVLLSFSFYFDIFDGMIQTCVFVFLASLYIKKATED